MAEADSRRGGGDGRVVLMYMEGGVESQGLRLGVGRGLLRGVGISKDLH